MQTMQIPAREAGQRSSPPLQSGYNVQAPNSQTSPQNLVVAAAQAVPAPPPGWQLQVTQSPQPNAPQAICNMGMNMSFELVGSMQGAMQSNSAGAGYAVPYAVAPPAPPEHRGAEGWTHHVPSRPATPQPPTQSPSPPPQALLRDMEMALIQAMPEYYDE